jgi:hypothetical protein
MTREGRRHPSNGIWLCQNCAKLVDNDAEQFPEDTLRVWKLRAETEALAAIGKSAGRATRTAYIDLQRLLVNSQTRGVALAKVVAEVLVAAKEAKIDDLASFCEQEILGWRDEKHATPPPYRFAGVFISLNEINLKYYGWGGNAATIFSEIRSNPSEFSPFRILFTQPVAELEALSANGDAKTLLFFRSTIGELGLKSEQPTTPIFVYGPGSTFSTLMERLRAELTRRLIEAIRHET